MAQRPNAALKKEYTPEEIASIKENLKKAFDTDRIEVEATVKTLNKGIKPDKVEFKKGEQYVFWNPIVNDEQGGYLIPKVQVDDLKSLKTGVKRLSRKKDWAKKFISNQKVEITITDGQYSWYDSIRIYLNIEDGVLYTKDNEVWDWELKFVKK